MSLSPINEFPLICYQPKFPQINAYLEIFMHILNAEDVNNWIYGLEKLNGRVHVYSQKKLEGHKTIQLGYDKKKSCFLHLS